MALMLEYAFGSIVGSTGSDNRIAITFDDGPDRTATPAILDVLDEFEVCATFFMLSEQAEREPAIAQMVLDRGHEVALHGANHDRLTGLSVRGMYRRIRGGRKRLSGVLHSESKYFRPPYGSQNLQSYAVARLSGMRVVVWSADPKDWKDDRLESVVRRAIDLSEPGAILLLHDGLVLPPDLEASRPQFDRAEMTRSVLEGLSSLGLQPTTVSDLLKFGRPRLRLWYEP